MHHKHRWIYDKSRKKKSAREKNSERTHTHIPEIGEKLARNFCKKLFWFALSCDSLFLVTSSVHTVSPFHLFHCAQCVQCKKNGHDFCLSNTVQLEIRPPTRLLPRLSTLLTTQMVEYVQKATIKLATPMNRVACCLLAGPFINFATVKNAIITETNDSFCTMERDEGLKLLSFQSISRTAVCTWKRMQSSQRSLKEKCNRCKIC